MKVVGSILLLCIFILTVNCAAQCLSGNCFTGNGSYKFKSGAFYTGHFENGKLHGYGSLRFSNGDKYLGNFRTQYRDGAGKMIFASGEEYSGNFHLNLFSGFGTMLYRNGVVYTGNWSENQPNGIGCIRFPDGSKYEGEVRNGNPDGKGTMYFASKKIYTGYWKKGKKNGIGKEIDENGITFSGTWENDKKVLKENQSIQNFASDTLFKTENCNVSFCHNRSGKYTYADGSVYIGEFKNGLPYGRGEIKYSSGDHYIGEWSKDTPNGMGTMHFVSGRNFSGLWEHGKPIKETNVYPDNFSNPVASTNNPEIKIWALVVGVSRYLTMPSLKYTDDDAYRFYSFLKSPEGGAVKDNQIRILIDEDASRDNILKNMRQLFSQADENDVIVFYFSGHGIEGSFIPVDFDGRNNRLPHEDIRRIFEESKAKDKVCIADACFSGSLLASKALSAENTLRKYYFELAKTKGGLALLMSSKGTEYSLEDQGMRSGIFSHFLINGLKGEADANHNKIITVNELYDFTKQKVEEYTAGAQSPCISGTYDPQMPLAIRR